MPSGGTLVVPIMCARMANSVAPRRCGSDGTAQLSSGRPDSPFPKHVAGAGLPQYRTASSPNATGSPGAVRASGSGSAAHGTRNEEQTTELLSPLSLLSVWASSAPATLHSSPCAALCLRSCSDLYLFTYQLTTTITAVPLRTNLHAGAPRRLPR